MQFLQNRIPLLPCRRLARQRLPEALRSSNLLDRLEVLDSLHLQFERGVFVDDDHGVGVLLERREGPHVVDAVFDAFAEGESFVGAGDDYDDFAGVEDGLHADCEGHAGDLGEVVVEEAGVGLQGVEGEGLDAGARGETAARFCHGDVRHVLSMYAYCFFEFGLTIESNVAVRTNAAEEQLNPTGVLDLLFVGNAFRFQVCSIAVQDVDVCRVDIHV